MSQTLMIGLDGATFSILDPLMDGGTMPFLKSLREGGARAVLRSTPNPLTAQAWPSMMTGRSPSHTGITDFIRYHPAEGAGNFELTNGADLRCETIWSIASRHGRTVTALNFYALWPPKPVAGYTISAFVPWRHLKDAVYPPDLYAAIRQLPNFNREELAMDIAIERKCLEGMPPEDYEEWILYHIRRERQWLEIFRHIMTTDPTDLSAVVFDGVDKIQHLCWRFLDPEVYPAHPSPWEAETRRCCLAYFGELDSIIGEVVELVGKSTRIFITSDHGFGPTSQIFYVNEWLHRNGYLEWAEESVVDVSGKQTSGSVLTNAIQIDWSRTRAYAISGSSNGIWLRGSASENRDVQDLDYVEERAELATALLKVRSPLTGEPIVTSIRTREDVYPGLTEDSSPDLLLTLSDGGFISVLPADEVVRRRPFAVGTHRPEGIFLAHGPGIRGGLTHPPLSILDVAPTLLYSLDLAIPIDLEGGLPEGVFEDSMLKARPPHREGTTEAARDNRGTRASADSGRDAAIVERLKALGYL